MREESELKALRPEIFSEQTTWNELETFQNEVLRPTLKFQHDIIIQLTKGEALFQKQIIKIATIEHKRQAIKKYFLSQPSFKYFLIGMICGLMTSSEFQFYMNSKKEMDKRLTNMLTDRILSYYC